MIQLPLRERKYAKTKSDLMKAVVARLESLALEEVNVKDVCNEVQVSETTFFNYFSSKDEVIIYYVQLWSIDAQWSMQQCLKAGGTHLDAIRVLFDRTAHSEAQSPGVMGAVVAYHAQTRSKVQYAPLTRSEYALHFPDMSGIDEIEGTGVDILISEQLRAAQQNQELSSELDLYALGLSLMSIFFMTPVMLGFRKGGNLREAYNKQLTQLLSG